MDSHGSSSDSMESMMMDSGHHGGSSAYFNTNYEHMIFLFEGLHIHSSSEYAGILVLTFLIAVAHEGLKRGRAILDMKFQDHNALMAMKAVTQKQTGVAEGGATSPLSTVNSAALQDITFTFTQQLARSVLYGLSVFLSMILMVIFMLFDVGLAVMVCAGAAIGFGIFQNKFSQKKSTARRPYSATPSNSTQASSV